MTESATLPWGSGDSPLPVWQVPGDAHLALPETPLHDATLPDSALPGGTLTDAMLTGLTPERPRLWASDSPAPRHCGTPMEWRSPEPAAMASYSFGPTDRSLALPALWRCRCGFQLDGVEQRGVDQGAARPAGHYPHSR